MQPWENHGFRNKHILPLPVYADMKHVIGDLTEHIFHSLYTYTYSSVLDGTGFPVFFTNNVVSFATTCNLNLYVCM